MGSHSHIGQNFLVNRNVAEKIVKRFLPVDGNILEIGPGKGILTDRLLKYREVDKNNKITAVELDVSLYYKLKDKYGENGETIQIMNRDILKVDLSRIFPGEGERVNVIGNIPYYISKELMDWVIASYTKIKKGMFMMQKEFVDKLASSPGSKDYNAQSVIFSWLFRLEKCFDVQPGSFSPQPRVKSTVFLFEPGLMEGKDKIDTHEFYRFLHICFLNRRKTLLNNLSSLPGTERFWEAFEKHGINPRSRAEELTIKEFLKIF
jgi:16S rRNA (adenine1518-N6/adenine1519-N6)-dimethyltransferase